jgi:predicted transcriptional regulator
VLEKLPPRERQIVALLYASGPANVAEICAALPVRISDSAVRAMLTRLVAKGFVTRIQAEGGYRFAPAVSETAAKESALRQLVRIFFQGSPVGAASALLGMSEQVEEAELAQLEQAIAKVRREQTK